MYVHHVIACAEEVRRKHPSPGSGVTVSCESLCGCWDLNLVPMKAMLLTAEPTYQPVIYLASLISIP